MNTTKSRKPRTKKTIKNINYGTSMRKMFNSPTKPKKTVKNINYGTSMRKMFNSPTKPRTRKT